MKYLFTLLFCSFSFFIKAQDSITVKMGKGNTFYVKMPAEKPTFLKNIVPFLPLISVFVALIGLIGIGYQIRARRRDDILKNQLERLNKQITDFYGPLYSLYETGHRNFYNFLMLFGNNQTFKNPHYKDWVNTVFQPTNTAMENIIINKADLILGHEIPGFLLDFCRWTATRKVYVHSQSQNNFDDDKWQPVLDQITHPEIEMQTYLKACFQILKEEQSRLLLGKKVLPGNKKINTVKPSLRMKILLFLKGEVTFVDEEKLIEDIRTRKEKHLVESQSPDTWENKIWAKVNEEKEKKETIRRQEIEFISKSKIPDEWKGANTNTIKSENDENATFRTVKRQKNLKYFFLIYVLGAVLDISYRIFKLKIKA